MDYLQAVLQARGVRGGEQDAASLESCKKKKYEKGFTIQYVGYFINLDDERSYCLKNSALFEDYRQSELMKE